MKKFFKKSLLTLLMFCVGSSHLLGNFVPFDPKHPFASAAENTVELIGRGLEHTGQCICETSYAGMESLVIFNKYRHFTALLCLYGVWYYVYGPGRSRDYRRDLVGRHCGGCYRGGGCQGVVRP